MYNRYQQQHTNTKEKALYESLRKGELDQLTDRRCPLPSNLTTQGGLEEAVKSLSKVYLAQFDEVYGLTGSMPQRRW